MKKIILCLPFLLAGVIVVIVVSVMTYYKRQGEAPGMAAGKAEYTALPHYADKKKPDKDSSGTLTADRENESAAIADDKLFLTGSVISAPDNAPLAGASVTLGFENENIETKTDRDGFFKFDLPKNKKIFLKATCDNFLAYNSSLTSGAKGNESLTIGLVPDGWIIRGRTVDEKGNPIEGAKFYTPFQGQTVGYRRVLSGLDIRSGKNGEFRGVSKGIRSWFRPETFNSILIYHNEYPKKTISGYPRDNGKIIDLGDVVLKKGFSASGVVKDNDGKPVEGATVYADDLWWKLDDKHHHDTTGKDGTFVIKGLENDSYIFRAFSKHHYPAETGELQVESDLAGIQLIFGLSGKVTGKVTFPDGNPIPGCKIYINRRGYKVHLNRETGEETHIISSGPTPLKRGRSSPDIREIKYFYKETKTNDNGEFSLEGLSYEGEENQSFKLFVVFEGNTQSRECSIGDELEFSFKSLCSLSGTIIDGETGKLMDREVRIDFNQAEMRALEPNKRWNIKIRNGRFEFTNRIHPAPFRISLYLRDYYDLTRELDFSSGEDMENVKFVFQKIPLRKVSGVVLDNESGMPVSGTHVCAFEPGWIVWPGGSAITDEKGCFTIEARFPAAGGHRIDVRSDNHLPSGASNTFSENKNESFSEIRLDSGFSIKGRLTTADGSSAVGKEITCRTSRRIFGRPLEEYIDKKVRIDDPAGYFRIGGLFKGRYTIVAGKTKKQVNVHEGEMEEVEIEYSEKSVDGND